MPAVRRHVPERGLLQQLGDRHYPVAVVAEQPQLPLQPVGHRRTTRHVAPVLHQEDLPPEGVRIFQQQPLHGPPDSAYLRLIAPQGNPPGPVESGGQILISHKGVGVITGKALLDAVHSPGWAAQPQGISPPVLHDLVQPPQICHDALQIRLAVANAVQHRRPSEGNVGVSMAGDLVPSRQQAGDQLRTMDCAALAIPPEIRKVVPPGPVPGEGPGPARMVRIVFGGVPHHDERSLGAVALQGFRQHKGQGLSPKAVRQGRQLAGAVLKGYGADPSRRRYPLNTAHGGDPERFLLFPPAARFQRTRGFLHKRHQNTPSFRKDPRQEGPPSRPCLINGGMPNGERFFRQSRRIFAGGLTPGKKMQRRVAEKDPSFGRVDIFQTWPSICP